MNNSLPARSNRAAIRPALLLPGESADAFQRLRDAVSARFRPEGDIEEFAVDQIAGHIWRYQRCTAMESAHLEHVADANRADDYRYSELDPITESALAFSTLEDSRRTFSNLNRYQTTLSQEIDRCIKRLRMLQRSRPAS